MVSISSFRRPLLFTVLCTLALASVLLPARGSQAADVTLAWDPISVAAGYKIYYGTQSRTYPNSVDVGNVNTYTIVGLQEGVTYYLAVTTYNSSRVESTYSNEVSKVLCGYSISPTSQSFPSSGGSATVSVTTSQGCAWTSSSGVSWVTIASGSSGSGSGAVGLSVAANTGGSRATGVMIAGKTFTVSQSAAAPVGSYTITASAGQGGKISPSGSMSVQAGASQTFNINPQPRFVIAAVYVDGRSVGAVSTYTFTNVGGDHTIRATFRKK